MTCNCPNDSRTFANYANQKLITAPYCFIGVPITPIVCACVPVPTTTDVGKMLVVDAQGALVYVDVV